VWKHSSSSLHHALYIIATCFQSTVVIYCRAGTLSQLFSLGMNISFFQFSLRSKRSPKYFIFSLRNSQTVQSYRWACLFTGSECHMYWFCPISFERMHKWIYILSVWFCHLTVVNRSRKKETGDVHATMSAISTPTGLCRGSFVNVVSRW